MNLPVFEIIVDVVIGFFDWKVSCPGQLEGIKSSCQFFQPLSNLVFILGFLDR